MMIIMAINRKVVGIGVIALLGAALVFGTVGSVMEVVASATAPVAVPGEGDYVGRLADGGGGDDAAAIAALKYVCPFH